jgi:hypothetical protein
MENLDERESRDDLHHHFTLRSESQAEPLQEPGTAGVETGWIMVLRWCIETFHSGHPTEATKDLYVV